MRHYLVKRTVNGWEVVQSPELMSADDAQKYADDNFTGEHRAKIAVVTDLPRSIGGGKSELDATAFVNPTDAAIKP